MVKNLPAMQETQVQSLWGRSPGGGNGNPLQCSCLKNPMDRGAWRATVHGVTKRCPVSFFSFFSHPMSFNSATRPLVTQFLEEKQRLREIATFVRDHALPLYSWHSHRKAHLLVWVTRQAYYAPQCSKDTREQGVNQNTHLVRQLEEPAAGDIHIIVGSIAMVISWLAGFGATSSSLWGPHT